jgi:four helix bundle protein
MSQYSLNNFGAYKKAMELFDFVVSDMAELRKDPRCYRLIAQQVGSADSVCANIEEGHGRLSRAEYIRFLDFARGSARETRGRYERMKHWLQREIIAQRVALADEIIAILTKTIETLQYQLQKGPGRTSYLKDAEGLYGSDEQVLSSTLDPRPSTSDPRPPTLDLPPS